VFAVVAGVVLVCARVIERNRVSMEQGRDAALQLAIEQLAAQHEARLAGDRRASAGELDASRQLIAQQLGHVNERIGAFEKGIREVESQRVEQFGALAGSLATLGTTTQQLRDALANSKARGQWGERLAEDVLRVAGFVEGISYRKQRALASGVIPDFTF